MNLHVRDVPDDVHRVLVQRAARRGMSLRSYVVEVLAQSCTLPTTEEWLDSLAELPPATGSTSAADALAAERSERDETLLHGARR